MQLLDQIAESVRLDRPCYFIKKNREEILDSQILHIEVFSIAMGQVGIEYTPNPGRLETYFQIEKETEWGETNEAGRKLFSDLVASWLEQQYELVDKRELMQMISGRSFDDMKKDPLQEILYFDGPLKVKMEKNISQIKIIIYSDEKDKLFYSDDKVHTMTFPNTAELQKKWNERVEDFTDALKPPVDETFFTGKYDIVHRPDKLKPLVFT